MVFLEMLLGTEIKGTEYKLSQHQDRLKDGFFRTQEGEYVSYHDCGIVRAGEWYRFAKPLKQDKLDEGKIKIQEMQEQDPYTDIGLLVSVEGDDAYSLLFKKLKTKLLGY